MAIFRRKFNDDSLSTLPSDFTVRISRAGDSVSVNEDATYGKFLDVFKGGTTGSLFTSWDVLIGAQDVEQLIRFRLGGASPMAGRYGILYNRYDGTTEATTVGYAVAFTPVSNTPSIIVYEDSVGTVNFRNYSWQNNQMYWARFRTVGNQQQFKIWLDGEQEPAAWTLDSTYSGPAIAQPRSGVGSYFNWANLQVFYLSAGTNGDRAPYELEPVPAPTISGDKVRVWNGQEWVYSRTSARQAGEWKKALPKKI